MSQNVAEVVEKESKSLIDKLSSNIDVANCMMALLGRLVIMAAQQGKPIEGIALHHPVWSGRSIKARIEFHSLSVTPIGLWRDQPDFLKYALSRSTHLAKAMERNPAICSFFTEFVEMLDRFADQKNINFSDVKLEKAFIDHDNVMVVNVNKSHTGRWS